MRREPRPPSPLPTPGAHSYTETETLIHVPGCLRACPTGRTHLGDPSWKCLKHFPQEEPRRCPGPMPELSELTPFDVEEW